jgi:hypothetical protein
MLYYNYISDYVVQKLHIILMLLIANKKAGDSSLKWNLKKR